MTRVYINHEGFPEAPRDRLEAAVRHTRLRASWRGGRLFADAEVAEDHVQDVLDVDPAGKPPQRPGSDAQLLSQQILAAGHIGRQGPAQGFQGVFQRPPMALPRHQRRLGAGQEAFGMPGEGSEKRLKTFASGG